MIKSISNRIKASVMSVAMAATVIPAYAVTMPATAAVSPTAVSAAAKAACGHGRFLAARADGRRCRRRQRSGAGAHRLGRRDRAGEAQRG